MDTEISTTTADQDEANSSHEVAFALVLSRMIDAAREDPAQLRSNIYELARIKLRKDVLCGDPAEEQRLMSALEGAIQGVESFSRREDESDRSSLQRSVTNQVTQMTSSEPPVLLIGRSAERLIEPKAAGKRWKKAGAILGLGVFLAIAATALAVVKPFKITPPATEQSVVLHKSSPSEATAASPLPASTPADVSSPPLPTVYGVYALNDRQLQEIYNLPGQIPDKRVAISAAITAPSRTTIADGKISFVIFRRDLVASAPEHVEVRVVAKIIRAMTFDGAGKPSLASVGDTWSVRNISYPFRVAPLAGNPEMMMLKSEDPDFTLPSGRYVVVIKGQGYDFTVAGAITDPRQCLEKIEAANGSFYAECRKP